MLTGLIVGEPKRHKEPTARKGMAEAVVAIWGPFAEFFRTWFDAIGWQALSGAIKPAEGGTRFTAARSWRHRS